MIIVSLDPGGTTGYCIAEITEDNLFRLLCYGMFPNQLGLVAVIEPNISKALTAKTPSIHIVCEDFFVMNAMNTGNKIALETIGAIRFWTEHNVKMQFGSVCPVGLVMRTPGQRSFVDKRFSNPYPQVVSHARSALQHAISYAYAIKKVTKFDFEHKAISF